MKTLLLLVTMAAVCGNARASEFDLALDKLMDTAKNKINSAYDNGYQQGITNATIIITTITAIRLDWISGKHPSEITDAISKISKMCTDGVGLEAAIQAECPEPPPATPVACTNIITVTGNWPTNVAVYYFTNNFTMWDTNCLGYTTNKITSQKPIPTSTHRHHAIP
jgi:hypothetical protein